MLPDTQDIDINRRNFIKASFVLTGAFVLGKVYGLFPQTHVPLSGTKEYQNSRYGFSLLHPADLTVSTVDEGSGASTITFQNVEKGEGFQIFVVPHEGTQTDEQRFKQDVPSGVRESLTNTTVDGATAAAFYSADAALGETREVWFAHKGHFFEVTTVKPLDRWLGAIIQTWKFV